jgi:Cu/Ag efflux protein CusF
MASVKLAAENNSSHVNTGAAEPVPAAKCDICRQFDQNQNKVTVNHMKVRPRAKAR